MTEWDFLTALLNWLDAPGFADAILKVLFAIIVVLIVIEIAPVKWSPITSIARKIGRAINADTSERLSTLEKRAEKEEKDSVRMQMLILLSDYPENVQEIMEVSRHYFHDIHGDWYMTTLFNNWLSKTHIGRPEWFNPDI